MRQFRWIVSFLLLFPLTLFSQKKQISLEDIFKNGTFRQDMVAGFRSMHDGRYYSEIDEKGNLLQRKFSDGQVEDTVVNLRTILYNKDTLRVEDYAFSTKEDKLLLFTEGKSIYRHSATNKMYLYDLNNGTVQLLDSDPVMHATFSPNGEYIAYIKHNDLYYYSLSDKLSKAITTDGSYNIINGNCDWVYEEEFSFTKAFEWSENSDYIAYYRFDQTHVPEYNFALYDSLYPTDYRYKYPKAGEKNSVAEIYSYYLKTEQKVKNEIGTNTDIYIPRIKINPFNNALIIYRLNRLQNHLEFLQANENGQTHVVYEEENNAYIEITDDIYFLKESNGFVFTSEKNGYNHIYVQNLDANLTAQITTGNWDVVDIKGVDERKGIIYYTSAEQSPMERHLYEIKMNGKGKKQITTEEGWYDIFFSEGYQYFMQKYSKLNTVPVYSICDRSGNEVRVLKDNEKLKKKMSEYDLSNVELMHIPNADGVMLNGWILKPSNFDATKKYPVLLYQYSGPASQEVKNQFGGRDLWWYQMLAQKGYIIACFDGTGTGFRGEAFRKKTYLQLGKYESDDQIAVGKYFSKQPYVDPTRIGIWGWSFGGYMSSICILKGADVFKTAIAVAPVTNWRYYDNIYTERYMRTPQENGKGYDDNSPVNMVKNLKGNYLLVHGTADDNVHLQNSMMMLDELIKNNKDFDSEMYPNKNHGISGGNTRIQLYRKMTNFILEKL